jgi:hypothetical protein
MILAARLDETLLIADVVPGDYGPTHREGHYLKHRRPELYKQLVAMQAACEGGYTYRIPRIIRATTAVWLRHRCIEPSEERV